MRSNVMRSNTIRSNAVRSIFARAGMILSATLLLLSCGFSIPTNINLNITPKPDPIIDPKPDPKPDPIVDPKPDPQTLTPRPAGSPDVVVLGVSGRCSDCNPPQDNWDYLGASNWGTLDGIAATFKQLGKTVEIHSYSSYLSNHISNDPLAIAGGRQSQEGFLQLEATYQNIYNTWIKNRSNPTAIVLVGHSHGVNWTHQLARAYPQNKFAYLIDFDGITLVWESDYKTAFDNYFSQQGKNPWAIAMNKVVGVYPIGSLNYDVKDVIPSNVDYGLELHSFSNLLSLQCYLSDTVNNIRPDGTKRNIFTYISPSECHSELAFGYNKGVAWVKGKIAELGIK
jgi:hypothetical protein